MQSLNIPFVTEFIEAKLDSAGATERLPSALRVIEFLLRKPFQSIPEDIQEQILQYLANKHPDGVLKHKDGFVWIPA